MVDYPRAVIITPDHAGTDPRFELRYPEQLVQPSASAVSTVRREYSPGMQCLLADKFDHQRTA